MSQRKIVYIFALTLLVTPASLISADIQTKKSWWRTMRDILYPFLSERNLENWNHQIRQAEGLSEDDIQALQTALEKERSPVPATTFADIAGGVPQEIAQLLELINNAERYKKFNIPPPKGILLVGPPGTGKTLLARALAGEAKCGFIATSATQFIEIYVGTGPSRIRELFEKAKRMVFETERKVIIFIDEIDAMGSRQSFASHDSESKRTLNELLTQMDGFSQDNEIIILAATNNPQDLDTALKRSGRFDTIIEIPLPDKPKRKAVIAHYLSKKPKGRVAEILDLDFLAEHTKGCNNADLEELVRKASLFAVADNAEQIQQKHLEQALEVIKKQKRF